MKAASVAVVCFVVLLSCSSHCAAAIADRKLTHWYQFESGAHLEDSSGNNNHLTCSVCAEAETVGCAVGSGCARLTSNYGKTSTDTSGQFLQLPPMDFGPQGEFASAFSFSAWVKFDTSFNTNGVVGNGFPGAWARVFDFGNGQDNNNIILAFGGSDANDLTLAVRNSNLAQGDLQFWLNDPAPYMHFDKGWKHLVVVHAGDGNWRLYVDAVFMSDSNEDAQRSLYPPFGGAPLISNFLGKSNFAADVLFAGWFDQIRIYADVLTEADILELYREHAGPPELTHHYEFEPSDPLADSSGNGNTITAFNNPSLVAGIVGSGAFRLSNPGSLASTSPAGQYLALPAINFADYAAKGLTISVWYYHDAEPGDWARIFDFGNGAPNNNFIWGFAAPWMVESFRIWTWTGSNLGRSTDIPTTPKARTTGMWRHLAIVITPALEGLDSGSFDRLNGGGLYVYSDGRLVSASPENFFPAISGPLTTNYIGRSLFGDPYLEDTTFDDLRIYKGALKLIDIHNLYQLGTGTAVLTRSYQFEQGAFLEDSSGNGQTLTAIGAGVTQESDAADGTGSALFTNGANDATGSYLVVPGPIDLATYYSTNRGISFSIWIKLDAVPDPCAGIFDFSRTGAADTGNYLFATACFTDPSRPLYHALHGEAAVNRETDLGSGLVGTWHHVVFTVNEAWKANIYVDGQIRQWLTGWQPDSAMRSLDTNWLGRNSFSANPSTRYNGRMDDVRVYQGVLSYAEVITIYESARAQTPTTSTTVTTTTPPSTTSSTVTTASTTATTSTAGAVSAPATTVTPVGTNNTAPASTPPPSATFTMTSPAVTATTSFSTSEPTSTNVTKCPENLFLATTGECLPCPVHSVAPEASVGEAACLCLPGYEALPAGCSACDAGSFKNGTGPWMCLQCTAGTFSESAAGACEPCEDGYTSQGGARGCVRRAEAGSTCHNASIRLGGECGASDVLVFGCATNQSDFQDTVLTVGVGAARVGVQQLAASCRGFFEWFCSTLGATASESLECGSYCAIMRNVQDHGLCTPGPEACTQHRQSLFTLFPPEFSMCQEDLRYAFFASCNVPPLLAPSFAADLEQLLEDFSTPGGEACSTVGVENARLEWMGEAPLGLASELGMDSTCNDVILCDFACFHSGLKIARGEERLAVSFGYVGACACPVMQANHVVYNLPQQRTRATSTLAANLTGSHMGEEVHVALHARSSASEITAEVRLGGRECVFSYKVAQGSFLGLPKPVQAESSPTAGLAWKGLEGELSADDFFEGLQAAVAQAAAAEAGPLSPLSARRARPEAVPWPSSAGPRRRGAHTHRKEVAGLDLGGDGAGLAYERGRSAPDAGWPPRRVGALLVLGTSYQLPAGCPVDEASCVFACIKNGFSAESYAGVTRLVANYQEGDCDCHAVFGAPDAPPDTDPRLLCTATGSGETMTCDAIDLLYEPGLSLANVSLAALGPATVDLAYPGTLPVLVSRAGDEELLLSFGPGVCVYRFQVIAGLVLGAGNARARGEGSGAEPAPAARTRLALLGTPSSACPEDDCDFACVASGLGGVSDAAEGAVQLVGAAAGGDPSCACRAVPGTLSSDGSSFVAGGWTLTRNAQRNSIEWSYGQAACSGAFEVTEGSFLGIPVAGGGAEVQEEVKNSSGIAAVTVAEAEAAAAGLTVAVAAAVAAAVAGAVAGAVGGAVGGAAGGGGGGGGGGGAVTMIHQTQFLAVAARIGGPNAQPESSQALSEGMGWANFHVFTLRGDADEESSPSRRGQRRAQLEGESRSEWACRLAKEGPRELGATVVMAGAALLGSFFGREAICRLLMRFRANKGLDPGDPALPFPSWEVQVFLTQFQGLAIASGCFPYEFGGGLVLVVLLLGLAYLAVLCHYGIRRQHAVWKHVTVREALENVREVLKESEGQGIYTRATKVREALDVLVFRGEWESKDHPEKKDAVHTSFVDRYGALFGGNHKGAWWYSFWGMFRGLAIGVILAAVLDERSNAGAVLSVGTLDFLIHTIYNPDGDWMEVAKNIYRNIMNISVIASVLAYINGVMPDNVFSNVFQLIGIITMVPMIATALFAPVINLVSNIRTMLSCITSAAPTPGALGGVAAIGAAAGVAFDRDAIIEQVQAAREEAAEREGSGGEGRAEQGAGSGSGGAVGGRMGRGEAAAAHCNTDSEGLAGHAPYVRHSQSAYPSQPNMVTVPFPQQPSVHRWVPPDSLRGTVSANGNLVYPASNNRSSSCTDRMEA